MKEFKIGDKVIIKGIIKEINELSDYPVSVKTGNIGFFLCYNKEGKYLSTDKHPVLFHDNTEVIDKIVKATKELLDADLSDYIKKAGRLKETLETTYKTNKMKRINFGKIKYTHVEFKNASIYTILLALVQDSSMEEICRVLEEVKKDWKEN